MRLQVFSVYLGVDVRNYFLDTVFFIAFVWGCATAAVVFYGVDSVDREGGIDLKNRDNFQWLHVSQTFPKLYLPIVPPFDQGAGLKVFFLWVPRMFEHIRDNGKLEFKSKTR